MPSENDSYNQREFVQRLLEEAQEALASAKDNCKMNHVRTAGNRAYYAMYNAACSALATKGITDFGSHKGVINRFGEHFVKEEIVGRQLSKDLRGVEQVRYDSDYHIMRPLPESKILEAVKNAEVFVASVEQKIIQPFLNSSKKDFEK